MQMQNTDMLIHQHLQQMQQIILAKDQELHHYRQRISVLEGEVTLHAKHNQALQGQVSARPVESSNETKDLKDQITQNHEQLLKEKEYTKVLNSQLLDTEKNLRDELTKRKLAEDRLFQV